MKDPAAIPELDRWIRAQPQMQLQALSERKYYEEQAGPLAQTLQGLATFVAVVMGIGAVFGAINTMYAIVAARTREIGTLRALGFSRRSILVSFLIESVILAVVGGAIGCLLAFPMNGFSTGTGQTQSFSEIAFAFRITPEIVATGMIFAAWPWASWAACCPRCAARGCRSRRAAGGLTPERDPERAHRPASRVDARLEIRRAGSDPLVLAPLVLVCRVPDRDVAAAGSRPRSEPRDAPPLSRRSSRRRLPPRPPSIPTTRRARHPRPRPPRPVRLQDDAAARGGLPLREPVPRPAALRARDRREGGSDDARGPGARR